MNGSYRMYERNSSQACDALVTSMCGVHYKHVRDASHACVGKLIALRIKKSLCLITLSEACNHFIAGAWWN